MKLVRIVNIIFVEEKVQQEKDSFKLHFFATKMAATLTFLLISSLLQGALCGTFNVSMPQNINVVSGSCVTIPCSFDVDSKYEDNLDDTCKAYWNDSTSFTSENAKLKPTKDMTGDLTKKDCTTTFNNASLHQRSKYYFRLECNNALKYTFSQAGVDVSFIDVPPSLTLTPSTLEVKEGTSVSLTCSAPAPCWSHPPALTWSPNLGQSQETLQENQDKTKVKTSVMSFTASHLHHGNKISCTAVYRKQDGSPDVTAETSLTPDISNPPSPTLTPSTLEVKEGDLVSVACSAPAPAPCWSHPPALTWTPNLGQSQETLQENQDKTKVKTSVMNFTASHLHHGNKISCTAAYQKQDGSPDVTAETNSPKNITVSVSPSGPVPENSNVSLTCSSNANPAVRNYTWYRADGGQETLIGTGTSLNIKVSRDRRTFFCKAENEIGVGRSSSVQIDVQYSPKNIAISVSPSGPVPENSNVSLTCSSNANPAVRNYTWYRADGDQETLIGTGTSLNIQVSRDRRTFFCKAENEIGVGRSSSIQIDVQYSPKNITVSVSPSGPVPENSNVSLTCSSNANPAVRNYTWYRADGDQETLIGTGTSLNIQVSRDIRSFFCKAENEIGVGRSSSIQIDVQYSPKNITVSVSPSGPVPENSNVSLTCSSNANPAVRNYTWYRADGDQETLIGTGTSLNIQVLRNRRTFFCKAENEIGVGRSSSIQIDVQYSPKNITVSVSPSGPVPENSNVSLTCSSNANPAVRNFTWYRADGDQEALIGTGTSFNIQVFRDRRTFFCKAENELGVERSNLTQLEIHFLPQILFSSDCVKTGSQVNCSCDTEGNPSPAVQWHLNGEPVNQSGGFVIFSETLNITVHRSSFILSQPQVKHFSTLLCRSFNSLGSASQQFCMSKFKSSAEPQGSILYPAIVFTLVVLLLALMCVLLFVIRTRTNHCKPKVGLIDENNTVAIIQPPTEEGNEVPNTTEESIYANAERLREAGIVDPTGVAEPSSTNLPSAEPAGAEGGSKNSENKGDKCEVIYSSVNWKTKSKKKKEETSVDLNSPGSSYLEEEKCIVGINRNFVSNALEMGGLYDEVGDKYETMTEDSVALI
ncbi:succinate dehydrogenase (ubiquinone) flavoprotein subunit [Sarotherodon galilaeus]